MIKYCGLSLLLIMVIFRSYSQETESGDSLRTRVLGELSVMATRREESLLQAPVSIEKMNLQTIKQSAQPGFFDAITNLKGVQVITPSLGFKVINARGFATTTNVRFVQMVDGIDNQAPHIGAPIGNTLGPNDLDILAVEVVPGSSSAIYGMNAINGIANFTTRNPFQYPGVSFSQKTGLNNVNTSVTDPTWFSESNLRLATVFNPKWAIKVNGTFIKCTDWYADSRMDLNSSANVSTGLTGSLNPGSDQVNIYGDESANRQTLTLGGKQYVVSRTGYAEKEVADYGIQNFKGDVSLYFRPRKDVEISYTYRGAKQSNIYQRTNRFRFHDYVTQQHSLTIKSATIQFRTSLTQENTGNSYNIRSMAENVDRSFKSDNIWFSNFSSQFNSNVQNGYSVADAMRIARAFSDQGRIQPNTQAMTDKINELRTINNWDIGAALRVKANLVHAEFQHDVTNVLFKNSRTIGLMYGLDARDYVIVPDGNYFINPTEAGANLNYWKVGGFVQGSKALIDNKIKINAVVRLDKNQYFDPKVNPRLGIVYTPDESKTIRFSVQHGFRFPSIFEAFSNINSGGRKRVGGLPIMSNGIFENSYTQASITQFQRAVQTDINTGSTNLNNAIAKEQNLLKKNPYSYLQPEQVTSWEVGYRANSKDGRLSMDIDFYYNVYRNLIAQIDANIPKIQIQDSIPYYLQKSSGQDPYRLWTNSKTISYNYGATIGLGYNLSKKFRAGGNFTLAKLERQSQSDGFEDGFNTPAWTYNVSFTGAELNKIFGFNINFRQQSGFLWQSALATGNVPSYSTIDMQVNARILENALNLKLGATNLLNQYYFSFIGGPAIGGFYYVNVAYTFTGNWEVNKR